MSAREWMLVGLGAAALASGCGGDGGGGGAKPAEASAGAPVAKEPLAQAATRLQRAVPSGDCKALGALMLHSVAWGKEPAAPPTRAQCSFVQREARNELRGYRLTKAQQFGPAGMTEGSGARRRAGEVVGVVWALDRDGSWKAVYDAIFRPQVGIPPEKAAAAAANARRFVAAVASRNCADFWRLLNVGSRFVRGRGGNRERFCHGLGALYRDPTSGYAQVRANPDARPRLLGGTRDIAFFGLELANGRYMVLVLAGRLGGIADAEQKDHEDPSVLEWVTVRRPAG
jgi:hypothetical protein